MIFDFYYTQLRFWLKSFPINNSTSFSEQAHLGKNTRGWDKSLVGKNCRWWDCVLLFWEIFCNVIFNQIFISPSSKIQAYFLHSCLRQPKHSDEQLCRGIHLCKFYTGLKWERVICRWKDLTLQVYYLALWKCCLVLCDTFSILLSSCDINWRDHGMHFQHNRRIYKFAIAHATCLSWCDC